MRAQFGDNDPAEDEVHEILLRALRLDEAARGGRDEERTLAATARELGISEESLEAARVEIAMERAMHEFDRVYRVERRRQMQAHLVTFLLSNAALIGVNYFLEWRVTWAWSVLLFWAAGLALLFVGTYAGLGSDRERAWTEHLAEREAVLAELVSAGGDPQAPQDPQHRSGNLD